MYLLQNSFTFTLLALFLSLDANQNTWRTFSRSYSSQLSRATMFDVCRSLQLVSYIVFYACSSILSSFVLDTLQISSAVFLQTLLPWKSSRPLFRTFFFLSLFWVDTLCRRTTHHLQLPQFTPSFVPLFHPDIYQRDLAIELRFLCDSPIFKDLSFRVK